jgi:hypothetical protein
VVGKKGVEPDVIPDPKPKPEPKPDPKPIEVEGPLWVLLVEETSMRTIGFHKLISDTVFWDTLRTQGYKMRIYDITSPEAKKLKLEQAELTVPFVVIAKKNGDVFDYFKLPATAEELKAKLPKIKGN